MVIHYLFISVVYLAVDIFQPKFFSLREIDQILRKILYNKPYHWRIKYRLHDPADVFRLKGYFKLPCYGLLHAPDNKDILCDRILHCLVIAKIEIDNYYWIDIIDKKLLLHGWTIRNSVLYVKEILRCELCFLRVEILYFHRSWRLEDNRKKETLWL